MNINIEELPIGQDNIAVVIPPIAAKSQTDPAVSCQRQITPEQGKRP